MSCKIVEGAGVCAASAVLGTQELQLSNMRPTRSNLGRRWSVKNLARLFNVREERVMAIVALQQLDAEARERGDPLWDDLQALADQVVGATEMRGTGERHIRLLPTRPAFEVRPCPAI